MIRAEIIKQATALLGKKEIKGNQGFYDQQIDQEMRSLGFQDGYAWCALAAELAWTRAYNQFDSTMIKEIEKYFTAGAQRTYRKFKKSPFEVNQTPEPGDVVVWKKLSGGRNKGYGHVGIVTSELDDEGYFTTIEGNTNARGSREGDGWLPKRRKLKLSGDSGLIVMGFIKPKEV
ncbi:MAG: hypothetical protein COA88_12820 [Kordia sp.]|nr:MAG: hypothetical protein COA88_12820 [Kordia sp.]